MNAADKNKKKNTSVNSVSWIVEFKIPTEGTPDKIDQPQKA
jgi:hypothetical protein